jgi:transcriptional regulator with XRE-family HTH domain
VVNVRKNLKDLRKKRGFSQKELAEKLDISERQYQRIEAGTSDGSVALWQNLKTILKSKTIDYLLEQKADESNFKK